MVDINTVVSPPHTLSHAPLFYLPVFMARKQWQSMVYGIYYCALAFTANIY